ncbi:unnamed protein product [Rotaria sp. Silwood1]|nr:unnamed protein product [Rotaria sp. Silwood1]
MSTLVTVRQTTTTNTNMNTNNGNNNIDSQSTVRSYGITQSISMKGPDASDRLATENLEDTLRSYDYFESDAELAHRVEVMAKLNTLVRKWIRDVSLAKNVPPEIVDTVGGRVHTFGSYRLGNADFIVNEGYFQCRQVENDIRKITNKYHVPDLSLNTQTESLLQTSNISTPVLQLIETNWFVYRSNLFLYVTIKNTTNNIFTPVYLFGIDKNSNKIKLFNLTTAFQSLLNEQTNFNLNSNSCMTFILTTLIELDKDIDIELYLLINDNNKLFRVGSINILIDDLIHPNNERILKLNALETESIYSLMYRQALIYVNTLFRLDLNIQSTTTKFQLIEHFRQLLSTIGFNPIIHMPNVYIRVNKGNIFEHVLIHLVNEDNFIVDDLIVHFYAENSSEAMMIAKYILSKLDFQSFSLTNSINSSYQEQNTKIINRIQTELTSYINILKQVPTIMRKIAPTSKSESYRLLKLENFQLCQNECHLTDLLLTSLVID